LAGRAFHETVRASEQESAMIRTFPIALFSAAVMLAACKKAEQPARATADPVAKAVPGQPADPAKPADPAAKPADPAATPATGNNALETQGIAMMHRMADMFVADGHDCDKLANDIKAFVIQNKALMGQLTAMEKQQTEAERAAFETRNRAMQEEMMAKVSPVMDACSDNKEVEAAMKELTD
jgi:hypothetical protein